MTQDRFAILFALGVCTLALYKLLFGPDPWNPRRRRRGGAASLEHDGNDGDA